MIEIDEVATGGGGSARVGGGGIHGDADSYQVVGGRCRVSDRRVGCGEV